MIARLAKVAGVGAAWVVAWFVAVFAAGAAELMVFAWVLGLFR